MNRDEIDTLRRALGRAHPPPSDPIPLRALLHGALRQARLAPALAADWRMAEAALGDPNALELWEAALEHLPSPDRDGERQYVHEQIAARRLRGGDRDRGRKHLEAALALAKARDDQAATGRLAGRLGALLVSSGLPAEGEPLLWEALRSAEWVGDTLREMGLCTALAGLRLQAGDWAAAGALGARTAQTAAQRGNWLGVADGLITQSVSLQQQGAPQQALVVLLYGAVRLQRSSAIPALNLIKAHIFEMQTRLGDDRFTPLFAAAQAQLAQERAGD